MVEILRIIRVAPLVGAFVAFIGQNVRSEMETFLQLSWARLQGEIPIEIRVQLALLSATVQLHKAVKRNRFIFSFISHFFVFVLVFGPKEGLSVLPLTAGGIDSLHSGFNCVLKSILNALTRFGQGNEKTIGWRELNIYGLSAAGILAYN